MVVYIDSCVVGQTPGCSRIAGVALHLPVYQISAIFSRFLLLDRRPTDLVDEPETPRRQAHQPIDRSRVPLQGLRPQRPVHSIDPIDLGAQHLQRIVELDNLLQRLHVQAPSLR